MLEFDSLADFDKWYMRIFKDEETKKIRQEMMLLVDPATYLMNIWNSVCKSRGKARQLTLNFFSPKPLRVNRTH